MPSEKLQHKIAKLPTTPGVYLLKDEKGVVVYVGKAKSLRSRVASYFHEVSDDTRLKIRSMIPQITDIEYLDAESEIDALLMEARLIKDIQPKYNEDLRDSKLYPYLEITREEDFPGVYITRQRDNPHSKFYGPFTDARGLRLAAQLLQRVFRFRTCTLEIYAEDVRRRYQRPCLLYYIHRCAAPCADRVSQKEYQTQIELLQRFLDGKRFRVLKSLHVQMQRHASVMEYEKAAQIRDQISALEALGKRGSLDFFPEATQPPVLAPRAGQEELGALFCLEKPPRVIEGVDAAHLGGDDAVGSVVTFLDGRPYKAGYRRFRIKTVPGIDDYAMIAEVVKRRFRRLAEEKTPFPDILLIDGGKGQLQAARSGLQELRITLPLVVSIAKREELLYHGSPPVELKLNRRSEALRILQYVRDEAHRFAVHYHHLLRGKRIRADI